jgi:hypothetical protein
VSREQKNRGIRETHNWTKDSMTLRMYPEVKSTEHNYFMLTHNETLVKDPVVFKCAEAQEIQQS